MRDVWFADNICKQQRGWNLLLGTQVYYEPARYCQWGFKKIKKMIFLLFVYRINDHSSPISSWFGMNGFKIKRPFKVSQSDCGEWASEENMLKSFCFILSVGEDWKMQI